jgi:D-glycero-D-manno-heptose 1,7-bisphosphate phosphatase
LPPRASARPAGVVFLDRDGVINTDSPEYIKSLSEFHPIPGSLEAMARLSKAGFALILVTNQSALARGLIGLSELNAIHDHLSNQVRRLGGRLDDVFYCPHHPDDHCGCRKPKPGLIHQACQRHGIDLDRACLVGDSARDLQCARAAGCRHTVLVRSPCTSAHLETLRRSNLVPGLVSDNLQGAVDWILAALTAPAP